MDRNLKFSLISVVTLACVMLAWRTISAFCNGGMGLGMVALLLVVGLLAYYVVTDAYIRSRVMDLFVLSILFTFMELIVFCASEFGWADYNAIEQFSIYQTFLSIVGFVFLAYSIFRFMYEANNWRFSFIETILGNRKRTKKVKQSKELTNGSLEAKPNRQREESQEVEKEEGEE